jgi:hypothetical protein
VAPYFLVQDSTDRCIHGLQPSALARVLPSEGSRGTTMSWARTSDQEGYRILRGSMSRQLRCAHRLR